MKQERSSVGELELALEEHEGGEQQEAGEIPWLGTPGRLQG